MANNGLGLRNTVTHQRSRLTFTCTETLLSRHSLGRMIIFQISVTSPFDAGGLLNRVRSRPPASLTATAFVK